jgi:hypothetical protein
MSIEMFSDLIGIRSRDFPVCSIVPEPTTLPRAPTLKERVCKISAVHSSLEWTVKAGSLAVIFLLNISVVPSAEMRAVYILLCYTLLRILSLLRSCNGYSVLEEILFSP